MSLLCKKVSHSTGTAARVQCVFLPKIGCHCLALLWYSRVRTRTRVMQQKEKPRFNL